MGSTGKIQYTPRDVRVAFQLAGEDPGPLILIERHDAELVKAGFAPVTRVCSWCVGTDEPTGTVQRIPGTESLGAETPEERKYRCMRCAPRAARLRVPESEIAEYRNARRQQKYREGVDG